MPRRAGRAVHRGCYPALGSRCVRQARLPDLHAGGARADAPRGRDGAHGVQPGRSLLSAGHAHRRRPLARILVASRHRDRADAAPRPRRPRSRPCRRLAPRRVGGDHGRRRARPGASRLAPGLRLALRRSRPPGRSARALRRHRACALAESSSPSSRTSSRRCSRAAGATACRWCRRRSERVMRCSRERRGDPKTSWPSCRRTSSSAASRRSRSTR